MRDYPPEVRRKVMESLIFLTEKRDGSVKGRLCANGSIQRAYITKEEASSPTVTLEAVILTCLIDAMEGRDVAIVDIPNAFIQTPNEKLKEHHQQDFMKVRGRVAELLLEFQPEVYSDYVVYERGSPVIYLLILMALCGMMTSSLLFYRKLRKSLEKEGFKFNPYDMCVGNKEIQGSPLTVTFHVDDIKASHKKSTVIDGFIKWCRMHYEDAVKRIAPSRGKIHDYLGITLDYSLPGKVQLYMIQYIESVLKEFKFSEEVKSHKKVNTPAAAHLFQVNPEATPLSKEKKEEFHTTVAKLLFLTKRTRPDLQPAVPFLCTRVQAPDEDDWKKLLRVLKWLESTKGLRLTLEAEGDGKVLFLGWWPDAAFAVHSTDMRSHTGSQASAGKGSFNVISSKQKLNTRSSTEAELVAADDVLPQALWTRMFLEHQGYSSETTIYQDNTSAMLLERNGMESSSKRTRHINVRFYFIKDCIDKKQVQVKYCPTKEMKGDYPSKPLQGSLFKKHLRDMMNLQDGQQECVEESTPGQSASPPDGNS